MKPAVEGNLAIRGTFGIEQAFMLIAGCDAVGGDDLNTVLGVPVGSGMVMVRLFGECTMGWAVGRTMGRTA